MVRIRFPPPVSLVRTPVGNPPPGRICCRRSSSSSDGRQLNNAEPASSVADGNAAPRTEGAALWSAP